MTTKLRRTAARAAAAGLATVVLAVLPLRELLPQYRRTRTGATPTRWPVPSTSPSPSAVP